MQFVVDVRRTRKHRSRRSCRSYTSRDAAISEPGEEAAHVGQRLAGDFEDLLDRQSVSWRHIWGRSRIELGHDDALLQALHLQLFHLLQTVSNNSVGLDVGVPARGLHGEAYRGHIFWDELFVFPFLSLRLPAARRERCCSTAIAGSTRARRQRDRGRLRRGHVPVAERAATAAR